VAVGVRRYIVKRLGQALLVLWAAYTVSFLLLSALPGDAVNNRIQNPEAQISPEQAQVLIAYYGLDRPLWEQYGTALTAGLRGDLGYSLTDGRAVTELALNVVAPGPNCAVSFVRYSEFTPATYTTHAIKWRGRNDGNV